MKIDVITLFPELVDAVGRTGMVRQAIAQGALELATRQLRDGASDKRRTVDDKSYGGGPGMVLMAEPVRAVLEQAQATGPARKVVYMSPQGEALTDALARRLAAEPGLIVLCGRYEGVDQRVLDQAVDLEVSVGDVVVSGGELPAMLLIDAVARLLPGVLGDARSAAQDSFADGLLDHPHYTRPADHPWGEVPEVLMDGDHGAIARWRLKQALGQTWLRRPDLITALDLNNEQTQLLAEFVAEQRQDTEDHHGHDQHH